MKLIYRTGASILDIAEAPILKRIALYYLPIRNKRLEYTPDNVSPRLSLLIGKDERPKSDSTKQQPTFIYAAAKNGTYVVIFGRLDLNTYNT